MKVVYMGTPDFAVGPLQAMLSGGVEVLAVVPQPDRPIAARSIPVSKKYLNFFINFILSIWGSVIHL